LSAADFDFWVPPGLARVRLLALRFEMPSGADPVGLIDFFEAPPSLPFDDPFDDPFDLEGLVGAIVV